MVVLIFRSDLAFANVEDSGRLILTGAVQVTYPFFTIFSDGLHLPVQFEVCSLVTMGDQVTSIPERTTTMCENSVSTI